MIFSRKPIIGYIGLGKMGLNMVSRLVDKGYKVVAYSRKKKDVLSAEKKGATSAFSTEELLEQTPSSKRVIWLMVPWKAVNDVLDKLVPQLERGDIVIDGGNSPYEETVKRFKLLSKKGIHYIDVGVSGGPEGAQNGACLMVGGEKNIYRRLERLFKDLSVKGGYQYLGESGAGHYVKMIHNGIEYGMMQSIGEGFAVLRKSKYKCDLKKVSRLYNSGSVIESRLMRWLSESYDKHGEDLNNISGKVSHSGEGEWTVKEAQKLRVPAEVIEEALRFRVKSQRKPSYTGKVVSALRNAFGGHDVFKK